VPLRVRYLGQWQTPWWEDGVDKGPKTRAGFAATTTINRHDCSVSWNSTLDRGGVVAGNMVEITIDAEAILQDGRSWNPQDHCGSDQGQLLNLEIFAAKKGIVKALRRLVLGRKMHLGKRSTCSE
jgi:hypothetical protein